MCGRGVIVPMQVYNLFDDVMLLAEGRIAFHGPRDEVL
jgi:ABC-type protease/lipase transport system fused ATPase/permease subunit